MKQTITFFCGIAMLSCLVSWQQKVYSEQKRKVERLEYELKTFLELNCPHLYDRYPITANLLF